LVELFFSAEPPDVDRAKAVCRSCSQRAACLSAALARREACGVWGGELLREGRILAETPRRGRPPTVRLTA
jgi:WhiB family redox-sensing transcriptional regulator